MEPVVEPVVVPVVEPVVAVPPDAAGETPAAFDTDIVAAEEPLVFPVLAEFEKFTCGDVTYCHTNSTAWSVVEAYCVVLTRW